MGNLANIQLVIIIGIMFIFGALTVSASNMKYGDINGDDKIMADDALLVLKHSANLLDLNKNPQSELVLLADVNADEKVDAIDALWILKYAAKIVNEFPAGQVVESAPPITESPTEVPSVAPTALPAPEEYPLLNMPVLSGDDEETSMGKLMYNYVAISDVHVRETDSTHNRKSVEKFSSFVGSIGTYKPDFILCAGDIGRDYTEFEYNIFKYGRLYTGLPWYCVTGNHDVKYTEEQWLDLTGSYLNYTIDLDGDIYIFVSLDYHKGGKVDSLPYEDSMEWLEGELKKDKGHRIFLTIHFPPTGYSGLKGNQVYGFEADCTQDDEIVKMIRETGNVILFTGHTHLMFEVEEKDSDVTVYSFPEENCHFVHIPSLGWPIDANAGYSQSESQFFFVNVYEDGVVLEGADNDYVNGTIVKNEKYVYTLRVGNKSN